MRESKSIKPEIEELQRVIRRWDLAPPLMRHETWAEIEGAITALDNAAYDRAYEQAHMRCHAECYDDLIGSLVTERQEVKRLKRDLEDERAHREHVEIELADARETIKRLADDGSVEHLAQRVSTLQEELREAHDTVRRFNDAHAGIFAEACRLRKERDEARAERDGFRGELELLHEHMSAQLADARTDRKNAFALVKTELARGVRLTKALETLADRYHAQMCYRSRQMATSHLREHCRSVLAVQDANEALAGGSGPKVGSDVKLFPGKIDTVVTVSRALTSEEVEEVRRVLFNDRKPKKEPEIEAVLMGTIVLCACKCGRVVEVGQCAYRHVKSVLATPPLYASEACARKAARPKARTHPPYAAYGDTDALRQPEWQS